MVCQQSQQIEEPGDGGDEACQSSVASTSPTQASDAPRAPQDKPLHDVLAGAFARAGSQSAIHPLDTLKVRLQAGQAGKLGSNPGAARTFRVHAAGVQDAAVGVSSLGSQFQKAASDFASLYKGVVGAATGAGVIIGAYFAFYSTTKRYLKEHTNMKEGSVAFFSGATAAVGSSVVKVPIAVCIRSVQAGVYSNVFHAARSITNAAGLQGLFTGFLPTLLEDAPDMAVKFAVYETMRVAFKQLHRDREPATWEDLLMGGTAGAAAAAATTPLDVVKTRMMCSASNRPTILQAVQSVVKEGKGWRPFFRGVGPRALSNGLNSAIFFCFFEAIRRVLVSWQQEAALQATVNAQIQSELNDSSRQQQKHVGQALACVSSSDQPMKGLDGVDNSVASNSSCHAHPATHHTGQQGSGNSSRLACLSLAIPIQHLKQS